VKSLTALGALAAVALCVLALMFVGLLASSQAASCDGGEAGPAPSAVALADIPGNYLAAYVAAGARYKIDWAILAAVGKVETDHGRSRLPGVRSGTNSAGAAGPMQFLLKGTWPGAGVDGNADGVKNVYDFRDAIPAAARYLKASGAPADWRRALFAYNHASWYVDEILAQGDAYRASGSGKVGVDGALSPGDSDDVEPASTPTTGVTGRIAAADLGAGCDDLGGLPGGASGKFTIAPGANAPGRDLSADVTAFIGRMAGAYDGTLVVTTGTNHDKYSLSGNVSDHFSGNAADFGMVLNGGTNDGPVGDRIATAAFLAAGVPRDEAIRRGRAGGAQTVISHGLRVQVIWKIWFAGDHHNHVHVGIARV